MGNSGEWVKFTLDGEDAPIDVVSEAQAVLAEHGVRTVRRKDDIYLEMLDLVLSPRGLIIADSGDGGVTTASLTVSIVRATHPIAMPAGLLDFQEASGNDPRNAFRSGFSEWAQTVLPVWCDAVRETPEGCSMMQLTFPGREGRPEHVRRVILGPIKQMGPGPRGKMAAELPEAEDEHLFCPCCLMTNCLEAFEPLLKEAETMGVSLFVVRGFDGETSADCRLNGFEFEHADAALRAYAESWPPRGFEVRQQYVLFQTR